MENKEVFRKLHPSDFKELEIAIEGGKENGGLVNVELIESLVKELRSKDTEAILEVAQTCSLLLNTAELTALIGSLKIGLEKRLLFEAINN